jgi:hypothetical protein
MMDEEIRMGISDKRKYFQRVSKRYHESRKDKKSKILDEFCLIFEFKRNYAVRLLNQGYKRKRKRTGRASKYQSPEFLRVLKKLWWLSEWQCGKLLKYSIPRVLQSYERRHGIVPDTELRDKLLAISAASIDRVLEPYKSQRRKGKSLTKPGSIKRKQIPISTEVWDTNVPGFVEADTVSHCGESSKGPFVSTLTVTDIATHWTENRAVWTKQAENVVAAIKDIQKSLPFPIQGFDCDNGSEFLNDHLIRYFQGQKISLTRSRPYRKNDNAHVEQKNWTHARQLLGYARLDNPELVPLINDLYANEWSQWKNFIVPSRKLKEKTQIGSKIVRKMHPPATAYDRIMASDLISDEKKQELKIINDSLDVYELRERIIHKSNRIRELAKTNFQEWLLSQIPQ